MIELKSIGTIHTPFDRLDNMPVQPAGGEDVKRCVEVFEAYETGLKDLDGFSHIILLYHFHLSRGFMLQPVPFMDDRPRGVFATRAPKRPNPIGLSVVRLERVENLTLYIRNIDVLNGTPLLDIKPYVPLFDSCEDVRTGWLESRGNNVQNQRSDNRFIYR